VLYWYYPMVPDKHFDKPGKSPFMDMQLVPRYAAPTAAAGIIVPSRQAQDLGVRTALATRGRLPAAAALPGIVGWDQGEERVLGLAVEATVAQLLVRTPFARVQAGQPLLRVQAPAWNAALAEAAALGQGRSAEADALRSAARARLAVLGLPRGARSDGRGGVLLVAPTAGVLTEIGVREGQAVPAGTPLLRINGDRTLWVEVAAPPAVAGDLQPGAEAWLAFEAWPGERFAGRIEAVLPQVDPATRSRRVRVVVDNADGRLAAGMFASVQLAGADGADAVLVPSAAVIDDGLRRRVLVREGERFVPVAVRVGRSRGERTEILSGLQGGERVVVSGQFLIDSEANLSGALERLAPPADEGGDGDDAADPHAGHAP